ncbi:MAG: enoyl-CoA hydratase-related protein [Bacteroidetes bacterium]|nr:enoyl-CoA hydratase-related protein [Bacteroidota bacterium]
MHCGISSSAKMILGGDIVNARDAKEMGIIDYIAPKDLAFEFAWTLMQKMTHDRPVKVIRSIMKSLKNALELSRDEAMKEETQLFCTLARDEAERRKTEGV